VSRVPGRWVNPTLDTTRKPPDSSTIFLLTSHDDLELRWLDRRTDLNGIDMLQIALWFVREILNVLLRNWGQLVEHFDHFLKDGKPFLNSREHDNLLVDDETFSRSRKYFWSLSCLSEFLLYINDAIYQWETSRDIWNKIFNGYQTEKSKELIKENNQICEKLKALRDRLQIHHNNVTALRDGLFNASAVMESRASTRLGGQTLHLLKRSRDTIY
jgi:hypothetical protein